ncbi:ND6, partial (mitochondrion) [Knipowitschia caucasica]
KPVPLFWALGLVVVSGMGCGVLVGHGAPFLSLVLFLIYLGGMLVVFAYSAALAAEPYPETLGSRSVALNAGGYLVGL